MEFNIRAHNKNEMLCCSVKAAKAVFKDTAIHLDFACFAKHFRMDYEDPVRRYVKKNIKGKVICALNMGIREESPILSFYLLKEQDFSNELKAEFEENHLPDFYKTYINHLKEQSPIVKKTNFHVR
ncbi:MAG: hypothetical protein LBQ40_01015 [Clostridiales bacterium]|jgi:mannose-6-phosphate isomerase class I|nr:hypothetical protein [Clostridiales bacterium]